MPSQRDTRRDDRSPDNQSRFLPAGVEVAGALSKIRWHGTDYVRSMQTGATVRESPLFPECGPVFLCPCRSIFSRRRKPSLTSCGKSSHSSGPQTFLIATYMDIDGGLIYRRPSRIVVHPELTCNRSQTGRFVNILLVYAPPSCCSPKAIPTTTNARSPGPQLDHGFCLMDLLPTFRTRRTGHAENMLNAQ